MTFAPQQKISKTRSRTRVSAWIKRTAKKLKDRVALNKEGNWLAHFADINGMYNWRQVFKVKTKSKKVTRI